MQRNLNLHINNLSPYIQSSRSIKHLSSGLVLEAKGGKVTLQFNSIVGTEEVEFKFKRLSGNGKVSIKTSGGDFHYQIASKEGQSVFVPTDGSDIEVMSDADCIGEVAIISCCCYTLYDECNDMKWKNILIRLNYNGLKVVGDRLFANEGAKIGNADDFSIKTNPENKAIRQSDVLFFPCACEITSLNILSNLPHHIREEKDPFPSMTAPNKIIEDPSTVVVPQASSPVVYQQLNQPIQSSSVQSFVSFDSTVKKQFSAQKNRSTELTKFISSNGADFLVLKKGGVYQIDLAAMKRPMQYVIVVNGKKLGGNGRLWISWDKKDRQELILDGVLTERFINLTLMDQLSKITLEMLDDGTGEIIINRLRVINGISLEEAKNSIDYSVGSKNFIYAKKKDQVHISDFSIDDDAARNEVMDATMKAATFKALQIDEKLLEITGSLYSTTRSGMQWIAKISAMLPNVTMCRKRSDVSSTTMVVTNLLDVDADILWLDTFLPEGLTAGKIESMKRCKKILTPSRLNAESLRSSLPSVDVQVKIKPFPSLQEEEVLYFKNKQYFVLLNRSADVTESIVSSWKEGLPSLAVVGARGSNAKGTLPINEYLDFRKMTYIMKQSKGLIDVRQQSDDYLSGWQSLARSLKVPVLTNAWSQIDNAVLLPHWQASDSVVKGMEELLSAEMVTIKQSEFSSVIKSFFS